PPASSVTYPVAGGQVHQGFTEGGGTAPGVACPWARSTCPKSRAAYSIRARSNRSPQSVPPHSQAKEPPPTPSTHKALKVRSFSASNSSGDVPFLMPSPLISPPAQTGRCG